MIKQGLVQYAKRAIVVNEKGVAVRIIKRSFMVVTWAQNKLTELIIMQENNVQFYQNTHKRENGRYLTDVLCKAMR